MGFPSMGVPQNGWFIRRHPTNRCRDSRSPRGGFHRKWGPHWRCRCLLGISPVKRSCSQSWHRRSRLRIGRSAMKRFVLPLECGCVSAWYCASKLRQYPVGWSHERKRRAESEQTDVNPPAKKGEAKKKNCFKSKTRHFWVHPRSLQNAVSVASTTIVALWSLTSQTSPRMSNPLIVWPGRSVRYMKPFKMDDDCGYPYF